MFITLQMNSDVPIYMQIHDQIVEGIASGNIKENTVLPSARRLAMDIGINFHTVNKAYTLLKQDGFIIIYRKRAIVRQSGNTSLDSEVMKMWKENEKKLISEAIARGLSYEEIMNLFKNLLYSIKKNKDVM
ncbi:MAG: GntR family transcriptional regulator [Candidatus Thermoplasmatota archaeon]|nr:GntR family transcriptional regulator [Candidatus Thermoplasmatota archaeon]MCL5962885.1 GntR family transcriptional regulator [Candidatus Thermoplasmatota archaeon]